MLEQCAQRVAKGRDALLPAYCTLCEVIHARANLNVVAELSQGGSDNSEVPSVTPGGADSSAVP